MHEIVKAVTSAFVSIVSWVASIVIATATLSNIALIVGIIAGIYSIYASRMSMKKNKS